MKYEGETAVAYAASIPPRLEVRRSRVVMMSQQYLFEAATLTAEGTRLAPGAPVRAEGRHCFRAADRLAEE